MSPKWWNSSELLESVYPPAFLSKLSVPYSTARTYQYRVLLDSDAWSDRQRRHLDECLQLARRHRALDSNCIARFRSDDDAQFFAKLYELRVAHRLTTLGLQFRFEPAGAGKSVLDFEVREPRWLVEVKSPERTTRQRQLAQTHRTLAKIAGRSNMPGTISIEVMEPYGSIPHNEFSAFLSKAVNELRDSVAAATRTFSLRGKDIARVALWDHSGDTMEVVEFSGAETVENSEYIASAVYSASRQLPRVRSRGTIVVVCPRFKFPASEKHFADSLYGPVRVSLNRRADGGWTTAPYRDPDGLFFDEHRSNVSAVIWLDEPHERYELDFRLVAFHNPKAKVGITPVALRNLANEQFAVVGDRIESV